MLSLDRIRVIVIKARLRFYQRSGFTRMAEPNPLVLIPVTASDGLLHGENSRSLLPWLLFDSSLVRFEHMPESYRTGAELGFGNSFCIKIFRLRSLESSDHVPKITHDIPNNLNVCLSSWTGWENLEGESRNCQEKNGYGERQRWCPRSPTKSALQRTCHTPITQRPRTCDSEIFGVGVLIFHSLQFLVNSYGWTS